MTEPPVFHITNILERRRREVEADCRLERLVTGLWLAVAVAGTAVVAVAIWWGLS